MRKSRKLIAILATLALLATLLVPMVGPAAAATDNYAISVPKVQNDKDDVTLGVLTIREDEDSDGYFAVNDVITINLPSGVEYSVTPTQATMSQYIGTSDPSLTVQLVAYADNYISFRITGVDSNTDEDKIYVYFGQDQNGNALNNSRVDIDADVTGDIKVEVDAAGTAVSSGYVVVGRIVEGDTTTTISSVETLPIDGVGDIGTIKIAENAAGVLEASTTDFIELVLPNDYEWEVDASDITSVGVTAQYESGDGTDTLRIRVTGVSSGQAGFITISGAQIRTPDDADEGDVEMTVKGNEVTEQDIVVAKVGDFGFKLSVDGDVETIVAGKDDQEIPTIVIDDKVGGSWISGRTVKLELPSWAEWQDYTTNEDPLGNGSVNSDRDELKYTVTGTSGKAELENMTVNIDADAPEGDLVVKISGSAGVEGELVIAKIVPPFKVTADKPEITVGVQNQKLGDITLTETEDGAIEEGKWVVFEAPAGMTFADTPDVEVTEGDIDIDDEDVDDEYFAFKVTGESGKSASTIKISNIVFDVDRTIPVGDVYFKVYLIDEDYDNDGTVDIDNVNDIANNDDELEEVTKVAVGTVVTPAPDAKKATVVFKVSDTKFTVNGVEQTMDVAPYVKNGRTYVPVRYSAQAVGVAAENILYSGGKVTLIKGDKVVQFTIGSNVMLINGVAVTMDVKAEITNGRTMLPFRYVAQALGAQVNWDPTEQTVTMTL